MPCLLLFSAHRDVYGVQQLANAVDKSQMILLRANFLSKCNYAEHAVGGVHAALPVILICTKLCGTTQPSICSAGLCACCQWQPPASYIACTSG